VDIVIFRELTGGIYFGEKHTSDDGNKASDECVYTRPEIERIAHLAFKLAQGRKKKVTLLDKSNVLETSRLWRKVVQDIAAQYPDVTAEYMYVDNAAVQVILNPKQFDVILTENMFGDIISDEASVLNGSMGMLPSASVGNGTALFEPIHGTFPKAAGKDIANPIGSILSAALMLEYFGLKEEAQAIRDAIDWTLQHNFVTKDIDPMNFYFTSTIGDLVSEYVLGKIPGAVKRENIELRKSTII
jgi:3-isopropylmalate dehydrogenase